MADTIASPTTTREAVLAAAKKMLADGLVEGTIGQHLRAGSPAGWCACHRRRCPTTR